MAGLETVFDKNDAGVLDFNLACSFRLELYELEKDKTRAKLIAYEVSKMFGENETETEEDHSPEVW